MMDNVLQSELIQYLVQRDIKPGGRVPPLTELSRELGVSVGKLREQLEVARLMGYVSVQPRLGTHRQAYDFYPAVQQSLLFGLVTREATFEQYSHLRQNLEASMWFDAVAKLTGADVDRLWKLVDSAWSKLLSAPVHIPNGEHRQLHLTIFSRLDNPFVNGLLKAYWDAYEATELTRFANYEYWIEVWEYHQKIVEAIQNGDYDCGKQLLVDHFKLLPTVSLPADRSIRE